MSSLGFVATSEDVVCMIRKVFQGGTKSAKHILFFFLAKVSNQQAIKEVIQLVDSRSGLCCSYYRDYECSSNWPKSPNKNYSKTPRNTARSQMTKSKPPT